jgi:hypothetical protein
VALSNLLNNCIYYLFILCLSTRHIYVDYNDSYTAFCFSFPLFTTVCTSNAWLFEITVTSFITPSDNTHRFTVLPSDLAFLQFAFCQFSLALPSYTFLWSPHNQCCMISETLPKLKNCNYPSQSFRTVSIVFGVSFEIRDDSKSFSFLLYTMNKKRQPKFYLQNSHVFIRNSDNFSGRYCLKDRQPSCKVSNSSVVVSCWGTY